MLAADVAKIFLAELANYAAKSARVKMRTSVALAECKMRHVTADASLDLLAVASAERGIFCHCAFVNVDLPANTTAVGAFIGDAREIKIVFRC
jgi:hypothetical protein